MKVSKVVFVCLLLFCFASHTDERSRFVDAVLYLIDREPGHPKKGDRAWADSMASALINAASEYDRDPWLLIAMANPESKFRPDIISGKTRGKADEIGILQCGPDCRKDCPHFMDTVDGQALCGARWLSMAFDACEGRGGGKGHTWAALAYYASGQYCDPPAGVPEGKGLTYRQKADKRIRLRDRLVNRFGGGN